MNRVERLDLAREFANLPPELLIAVGAIVEAASCGGASVVLVHRAGEDVRVSVVHAPSVDGGELAALFDQAFPVEPCLEGGSDAKSPH